MGTWRVSGILPLGRAGDTGDTGDTGKGFRSFSTSCFQPLATTEAGVAFSPRKRLSHAFDPR